MHFQMQEEQDDDSQCLSDDTDTEISTQVDISSGKLCSILVIIVFFNEYFTLAKAAFM